MIFDIENTSNNMFEDTNNTANNATNSTPMLDFASSELAGAEPQACSTPAPAPMLQFAPKEESSYIKVIGVGGGGGNAVNHMFRSGITGVDFIVSNTELKALEASEVPCKIALGELGAGNDPSVARAAALEHESDIRQAIENNTKMLFITAGMGGGTGTGAAPVIARIAKDIELDDTVVNKILVVAVVTMPFSFEGKKRRDQAQAGVEELRKYVDSILIINNDRLRKMGNARLTQGFAMADDILLAAVKGIAETITCSSLVSTDFRDVNSVMSNSGTALMGTGIGRGENRAIEAIQAAAHSELLNDSDIRGAKDVLLNFTYHPDHEITFDEMTEVTDYIEQLVGNQDANIIWGTGDDTTMGDELKVTLIATGYQPANSESKGKTIVKLDAKAQPTGENQVQTPTATGEAVAPTTQPEVTVQAPSSPEGKRVFSFDDVQPAATVSQAPATLEPVAQNEVLQDDMEGMHLVTRPHQLETAPTAVSQQAPVLNIPERKQILDQAVSVQTPVKEQVPVATFETVGASEGQGYTSLIDLTPTNRTQRMERVKDQLDKENPNYGTIFEEEAHRKVRELCNSQTCTSALSEEGQTTLDAKGRMSIFNRFLTGSRPD